MKIPNFSTMPGIEPAVALGGAVITCAAVGATAYVGGKAAIITAGLAGGCLFALAMTNVVATGGLQSTVNGIRSLRKQWAERQPKPHVETEARPAAAATS